MKMNEEDKKSISLEEALQMPELAHLHDTMRYLENASDSDIMPQKYEMGLEYLATKKTLALFNENATLPLKSVVSIMQWRGDLGVRMIHKPNQQSQYSSYPNEISAVGLTLANIRSVAL